MVSFMYMFCRLLFVLIVLSVLLRYTDSNYPNSFLLIIVIGYTCIINVLTCINKSDIKEGRIIFL